MTTSKVYDLNLNPLEKRPRRSTCTVQISNHDWKLNPNVQVKVNLKRLHILNDIQDHNNGHVRENFNTQSNISPRCTKRKRMSRSSSPVQNQMERSDPHLNSGAGEVEAMEELQKIVSAFEPECSICCKFVYQFSQHIRNLHSSSPPPSSSTRRPKTQGPSSNIEFETEIFKVVPQNNVAENNNYRYNVCDKLLPSTADPQTRLESNIKSEIQESHQMNRRETEFDVTGHSRSSPNSTTNEYTELITDAQTAATVFTHETDNSPTSNEIPPSLNVEYVKCEPGELEITDNYDLFQNSDLEGHHVDNVNSDDDDGKDEGNDSDSEFLKKSSLGKAETKCQAREKLRNVSDAAAANEQYNCDKCDMHFSTASNLRRHVLNKHPDQLPYKCDICPSGFKKYICLVQHKKTHTAGESGGSSSVIPRKTANAVLEALTETESDATGRGHRRSSRVRKTINYAEIIEGSSEPTTTLTDEQDIHEFEYNPIVDTDIEEKDDYDSSDSEDNESCSENQDDEDYTTATTNSGKRQMGIGPYKCNKCDTQFSTLSNVRRHSLQKHSHAHPAHPRQALYKCTVCCAGFKSFKWFALHKKTHKGEKPKKTYTALKARGKYFTVTSRLTQHKLVHPRESHKCETCGNSFGKECLLIIHKRLHSGERPYKCEHCDKYFLSNVVRINHERSHKSENDRKSYEEQDSFELNHDLGTSTKEETTQNEPKLTMRFKPKTCGKCHLHFNTTMSFNRHNFKQHNIESPTLRKYNRLHSRIELKRRRFLIGNEIQTDQELHKCKTCGKHFVQKHLFIRHKRLHRVKKPYHCECCRMTYSSKEARTYHTVNHTTYKQHRVRKKGINFCHICRLKFPTEKGFSAHIKSTHEDNLTPYRCNICKTGFSTGPDIRKHFIQTHPKHKFQKRLANESDSEADGCPHYPYKCDHCNRGFKRPEHLELHLAVHTKEKPHKCETCDKSFHLKDVLISHQSRHAVGKPSASEIDKRKVQCERSESDKKNFACGICTREYEKMKQLTQHIQRAHINILSNKFICKFCNEEFFTVQMLGVHVGKVHPGEKAFECKICHKEFANRYILIGHSTIHKEEKTVPCTYKGCTKMFKKLTTMRTHLILHTGDRPYKCEQCGKTFVSSTNLGLHKVSHSSDKPFMCEKCSKCFSRKMGLQLHMLSRHKEVDGVKYKPHVCKDCGKCFTLKSQLTTHSKIHTGEKSHMCEECGICFRLPHQLRAHLKTLAHTKREEL